MKENICQDQDHQQEIGIEKDIEEENVIEDQEDVVVMKMIQKDEYQEKKVEDQIIEEN